MVKSGPEIVYDTSAAFARRPSSGASAREWRNFMSLSQHHPDVKRLQWFSFFHQKSSSLEDMYKKPTSTGLMDKLESKDEELDIRKMLKEIELLGSPHMSWKERKALENQKVVTLGGKPPKKQRMPLSVASVMMKKQKEREQNVLQEAPMLTRSLKHRNKNSRVEKFKGEDRVLKASEGHFKKGVLNVERLLRAPSSSRDNENKRNFGQGKKKKGNGKKKGKKRH